MHGVLLRNVPKNSGYAYDFQEFDHKYIPLSAKIWKFTVRKSSIQVPMSCITSSFNWNPE